MAYKPGRKEGGVAVSDAASRVLGPEDPGARSEVEARRDREFSTMEQIGLAADMLPGGAIAFKGARGGKAVLESVLDAMKLHTGNPIGQEGMVAAARSSKGDPGILKEALKYVISLMKKYKADDTGAPASFGMMHEAKRAIEAVIDGTFDLKGAEKGREARRAAGADPGPIAGSSDEAVFGSPHILGSLSGKSGSGPSLNLGGVKGVETSKKTADIMATKDLPAATRMSKDMPPLSGKSRVSKEGLQDIKDVRSLDDKELLSIYDDMKDAPFPSPDIPLEFSSADEWDAFLRLLKNEIRDRGLF